VAGAKLFIVSSLGLILYGFAPTGLGLKYFNGGISTVKLIAN
jgi:hypothetical protein